MKSLYSGVAGLKVHNQRMDVIGNNVSNVNTTAFKASSVTFKDIFYQNKSYASTGDIVKGGTNANQVGYGANLGAIQQIMTQSGLTYSDTATDCAIQGEGFFQVMDQAGNIYYTRNGAFHIDNYGNLCDPNGNIVLGVSGDPTGVDASSQRINLFVPPVDNKYASVTKTYKDKTDGVEYNYTFSSSEYGEDGNISLTILDIGEGEVPFATVNGTVVTVRMDLSQEFADEEEFLDAMHAALDAGGVELPGGDINLEFESVPANVASVAARNTLTWAGGVLKNDDGTETTVAGITDLEFVADTTGAVPNGYEINLVANKNATDVKARWYDNVLTITIPEAGASIADIQTAIETANGTNDKRQITVSGTDITEDQAKLMLQDDMRLRVGLQGGKDNFFRAVAETMGTIKLTDGRVAADQTTKDLESIFIDDDGVIYGVHTVHGTIAMGRIDLVVFENPMGLDQVGTSYWKTSLSSGDPVLKKANDTGSGAIVSNALEMSNADLAQEISDMIITQRGFQANSRIITVTDTMLEELVNLKR